MNQTTSKSLPQKSLPNNWPNPTKNDLEERPHREIVFGIEQTQLFNSNFIKTSKYEIWNFPGKFTFEEFNPNTKFANCYFLFIAALQCIPQISNTNGYPTVLVPLIIVVCVDAIFSILEDVRRHKADALANADKASRFNFNEGKFEDTTWADVQVGDYIQVNNRLKL